MQKRVFFLFFFIFSQNILPYGTERKRKQNSLSEKKEPIKKQRIIFNLETYPLKDRETDIEILKKLDEFPLFISNYTIQNILSEKSYGNELQKSIEIIQSFLFDLIILAKEKTCKQFLLFCFALKIYLQQIQMCDKINFDHEFGQTISPPDILLPKIINSELIIELSEKAKIKIIKKINRTENHFF